MAAVIGLGKVEMRVTDENADETVVVDAERARICLGHFVEQFDGSIDETSFDVVGYLRTV